MAILKLTDICKDYQQGKEPVRVLKNIHLTVEKGDYLAIMGPSGSGKRKGTETNKRIFFLTTCWNFLYSKI